MRPLIRVFLAGLLCMGVAAVAVVWLLNPGSGGSRPARRQGLPATSEPAGRRLRQPFRKDGRSSTTLFRISLKTAVTTRPSASWPRSVTWGRFRSYASRSADVGRRGISALRAKYDQLQPQSSPTRESTLEKASLEQSIGMLHMYDGKFLEAASWLEKALATIRGADVPALVRNRLIAILGIIAMRRGEIENCLECVGPSSCIFPIAREAIHKNESGSRDAVRWFTAYLEESPRDLRVIWLLNIAYMTLGEYPDKVPLQYLIPVDLFHSGADVGRFENVAALAGLGARGPNLAGGSVFDDFNGDGLPDLFITSLDADLGASLYINGGHGTFEDRSASAGLGDQVYAPERHPRGFRQRRRPRCLAVARRLGDPDAAFAAAGTRGTDVLTTSRSPAAWPSRSRPNRPPGATTIMTGWSTCSSVVSTFRPGAPYRRSPATRATVAGSTTTAANGTFVNVAAEAGVTNERCAKGSGWGDYDGDGRLDLFVSNMGQESPPLPQRRERQIPLTSPPSSASPVPMPASLAGSGTSTTTASSTSTSTTTGPGSPRCFAARWD